MACSRLELNGPISKRLATSACRVGAFIRAACNPRRGQGVEGTKPLVCRDERLSCRRVFGLLSPGVEFDDQPALRRGLADLGQGFRFRSF